MFTIIGALIPVFLLISLGYGLKYLNFPGHGFWLPLEKLTYFILFPALLFSTLAVAPLHALQLSSLIMALFSSMLLMAGLTLILRRYLTITDSTFSSLFQGSVRFNTYVGLAVAAVLLPTHGLTLAALAVAVWIPLVNVLCVLVLSRYSSQPTLQWHKIALALLRNPLIIACGLGIGVNLADLPIPSVLQQTIALLGRAALPMGLLAVGAALQLAALQGNVLALGVSTGLKLWVFPMLTAGLCYVWQVDAAGTTIAFLFAALPTAPSAYMLARQMGGDATLMAQLITLQTLLAAFSLPLILAVVI